MTVVQGDMLAVLPTLAADSFDACVTDPPYHLASIVKRFSKSNISDVERNTTKTIDGQGANPYGRVARGFMGKEWDGGDIAMRPETWAEVLRVLKPGAHLIAFGGTRTHHRIWCAIEDAGFEIRDTIMWLYGSGFPKSHNLAGDWEGWGTALKPAFEPIILARKPPVGTVAANMAAHGTGAVNIDASRVVTDENLNGGAYAKVGGRTESQSLHAGTGMNVPGKTVGKDFEQPEGRWPANVIHDGLVEEWARFFYCAKASKSDREEGCENLPARPSGMVSETSGMVSETSGQHITRRDGGAPGPSRNSHPTVKPTALMRYLVRLVTPPGGVVLDPFTGSGSTGKAAVLSGFGFYGVEREDEYLPIAKARIAAATQKRYEEIFEE